MPDRLSDTALLQAVEVLMGQFSEQILALLEAHARGDVDSEAFEARIRDLVGAVSPEAVARHPGRLTLIRPVPPAPLLPEIPAAPMPGTVSFAPGEEALSVFPAESAPEAEPPARAEESRSGSQPVSAGEASGFPGQFGSGFEVEFEPEFPESLPETPPDQTLAEFVPAAEEGVALAPIPSLDLPGAEPQPEFPPPDDLPAEEGGVAGSDRLQGSEPAPPVPEIFLPEPEPASSEGPAILDGVSGYEPLPEFELDVAPAESAPPAPAPVVLAEPDAVLEPAPPAPEISMLKPEPASSEGPAILDGVSGYEHLLEPEPTTEEPPPARAQARPTAAPRPEAPPGGPAEPPRPRKAPAKGVAVAPSTPSHTPGGRPTAPAKPIPQPQAPAAQAKSPAAPAKTSTAPTKSPAPPAKAPAAPAKPAATPAAPPRRPNPSAGGGNVVVSGRLGSEDFKAPDRPGMGFGEQMFGNGGGGEPGGDETTSFMSRQVRRELQEKTTWKSPAKAALLSGLLPGVGDFYVGRVSTGLVFYLVFYILLMLFILRGDLVFVAVLAVLALTSSGVSWLSANKHNETVHRIQEAPSMQHKTRETTFTFDRTRRRR